MFNCAPLLKTWLPSVQRILSGVVIRKIREHLEPDFRPFAIRLSDGRRFEVPHGDFLALTSRTIVVIDNKDVSHTVSPLHVVSIEDPVQAK